MATQPPLPTHQSLLSSTPLNETHSRGNLENELISAPFSQYYKSYHLIQEKYPVHSAALCGFINEDVFILYTIYISQQGPEAKCTPVKLNYIKLLP